MNFFRIYNCATLNFFIRGQLKMWLGSASGQLIYDEIWEKTQTLTLAEKFENSDKKFFL